MDYSDLRKIVLDLFKDEWKAKQKSLLDLKLNADEIDFYYEDSCKMMLNFLHDFIKDNGFEKPEPTLEKTLFSKKYLLLGRIDAIHTSNHNKDPPLLVDFKTCKSKELSAEYKRQLGIYALLYKEKHNVNPTVGIHFLRFQDGFEKYKITDAILENTEALVIDVHEKTQSEHIEDYPCVCGWCDKNFNFGDAIT